MAARLDKHELKGQLNSLFSTDNIMLLDAGLGTTLEDVLHKDISHPLWSAHLIESDPEAIPAAHLAFLNAGSSIILTATYQCAPETFSRAGYPADQGHEIMHKAIDLALRARSQYAISSNSKDIKVALSLGPYGATLSPAAEFSGIYPPPYGPPQPGTFFGPGSSSSVTQKEREAEDALVEFHLNRLRVFASSKATWDAIDIIAFETVPLLREAKAIRRAMASLASSDHLLRIPPWWISFNFPNGVLPEEDASGIHYSAQDAVRACFEHNDSLPSSVPSAFGINCTQVKYVAQCLSEASHELQGLEAHSNRQGQRPTLAELDPRGEASSGPALVIYPNGGRVYNPSTMTWLPPSSVPAELQDLSEPELWARNLVEALLQGMPSKSNWSRLVIGGCCKTEPEHLIALKGFI
ncbi:Homocysteine S-methyltransferase [Ceratobasidium sp. AG-I]|nr:Homocysteine S-methyltransferase [Ceratobasidium sp. AG-I]